MTNREKILQDFPYLESVGTIFIDKRTDQLLLRNINYKWLSSQYENTDQFIPKSVIEDIKAEIREEINKNIDCDGFPNECAYGYYNVLSIIDKYISGK